MSEGTQRRLAAILAADVVGYSRLMSEDESATLDALRHFRREVFEPTVSENKGTLVKSMGDGGLVVFASVADGVGCAIRVQEALADHERIKLRIGLHVGDVAFEDEDIYGDGVNVASRLQELADPGSIIISGAAKSGIDLSLSSGFADLGAQELKNIPDPVIAYGWGITEVSGATEKLSLPDKPSIAVLPFDNMSGDPEQEYFSDGICEDIITELYRFPALMVVSRNSSFAYRRGAMDIKRVGRELGVRYVLEGSVRKAGQRVRITAQLIESDTGAHVWAERYDRDLDDIFAIQDEITSSIAGALTPEIFENEQAIARRNPPESLTAQDHFWRGTWHFMNLSEDELPRAREEFEKVLELQPDNASAHANLAFAEMNLALFGWHASPEQAGRNAFFHASRAVELDRNRPEGHLAWATVAIMMLPDRPWDQAFEACRTAIKLTPSFAYGHFTLGICETLGGDPAAAVEAIEHAMRLSPKDQLFYYFANILSLAHYRLRDYEQAEAWARRSAHANPGFPFAPFNVAAARAQLGRTEDAKLSLARALQVLPDPRPEFFAIGWRLRDPAEFEHLMDGLRKAGLPKG